MPLPAGDRVRMWENAVHAAYYIRCHSKRGAEESTDEGAKSRATVTSAGWPERSSRVMASGASRPPPCRYPTRPNA